MKNAQPAAVALALAACLLLPACAHHQGAMAAKETVKPKAPQVTGDLAEVDCGGLTPRAMGKQEKGAKAPAVETLEATLQATLDDDRLRAYLHCLVQRDTDEDP